MKHYTTKIDRMRGEEYTSYMLSNFGVLITEDIKDMTIKGFIIKNIWYRLYLPKVTNGVIESFRAEQMEYIGSYPRMVDVKRRIKEIIKDDPEQFEEFYNTMKEIKQS